MKKSQVKWVVGIDEVGRGPLAGPVVVCAAAYPFALYKKDLWKGVTDSKKMTAKARLFWYEKREEFCAAGGNYDIASFTAKQIDTKGIAVCIREAIAIALANLNLNPKECLVLLDGGLKAPQEYIHQQTIIKGDLSEKIISMASVLAKVHRDMYMQKCHKKHPQYCWEKNKGYGTRQHREALLAYGSTPLHRVSFLSRILNKK